MKKTRHGGYRPGAGRKGEWQSGKTKAVKLPEKLVDQVVAIARAIDRGLVVQVIDPSDESDVIQDLRSQLKSCNGHVATLTEELRSANSKIAVLQQEIENLENVTDSSDKEDSVTKTRAIAIAKELIANGVKDSKPRIMAKLLKRVLNERVTEMDLR